MFVDSRELPSGHRVETDICIVGAGAAGIALARELRASRFDVCVLESGGFDADAATQSLYDGHIAGLPYTPLHAARLRYFGGTTNHWSGWCRPLDPIDFRKRSWVPHSGWPFGIDELWPYYSRAEEVFGLRPVGFDISTLISDPKLRLEFDDNVVDTAFFRFTAPARFGVMYRDEIARADNVTIYLHANATLLEPAEGASKIGRMEVAGLDGKQFEVAARYYVVATGGIENARLLLASNTVRPGGLGNQNDLVGRFFMDHPGVTAGFALFTDPAQRLELYTGEMRQVSLVARIDGGNMEQFIAPADKNRVIDWVRRGAAEDEYDEVIAPILLRQCVSCHNPEGIAFHRTLQSYAEVMRVVPSPAELGGETIIDAERSDGLGGLRLSETALVRFRLLNYCALLEESRGWSELIEDGSFFGEVGNIAANFGALSGAAYRRLFDKESRRRLMRIVNVIEPSPNRDSRVSLTRDRDALGMPRVSLDWRLNAADKRTIARAQELIAIELGKSGLGRALRAFDEDEEGWPGLTHGWHHMGTTRMHSNPKEGVVDADCRVHGLSNLYVAGSSVFPTYGFSQPTFTIVALALRLADHLKATAG